MKVFIPNIPMRWDALTKAHVPLIDLSPASAYGELVLMLPKEHPVDEAAVEVVSRRAEEIDPDAGHELLCVGDVALIGTAMAITLNRRGWCGLLRWDRATRRYEEQAVTLELERV